MLQIFVSGERRENNTRVELLVNAAKPAQALLMKTDVTNNVINITRVGESHLNGPSAKDPLPVRVVKRVGQGIRNFFQRTWGALKSLF